ncbi:hypothetical protein Cgig2_022266 [Carnegiea gigantea]|uniref:60S acidic ribosomal protein P1 n=1 Tax=Carnegiea gigantea TaxID=171969 RepID=A0A9Q1KH76_9CARY|nr:hypothetical protein Cgig2_022266 [Carnegiea gigantea]
MSIGELACTYAALVLHDDGIAVTSEKISTLVKAANVDVESYWPSLFAKLVEKRNVEDLIMNVGSGGGAAPVAVAASGGAAASVAEEKKEEKKEEPKEESDDDMGFSFLLHGPDMLAPSHSCTNGKCMEADLPIVRTQLYDIAKLSKAPPLQSALRT